MKKNKLNFFNLLPNGEIQKGTQKDFEDFLDNLQNDGKDVDETEFDAPDTTAENYDIDETGHYKVNPDKLMQAVHPLTDEQAALVQRSADMALGTDMQYCQYNFNANPTSFYGTYLNIRSNMIDAGFNDSLIPAYEFQGNTYAAVGRATNRYYDQKRIITNMITKLYLDIIYSEVDKLAIDINMYNNYHAPITASYLLSIDDHLKLYKNYCSFVYEIRSIVEKYANDGVAYYLRESAYFSAAHPEMKDSPAYNLALNTKYTIDNVIPTFIANETMVALTNKIRELVYNGNINKMRIAENLKITEDDVTNDVAYSLLINMADIAATNVAMICTSVAPNVYAYLMTYDMSWFATLTPDLQKYYNEIYFKASDNKNSYTSNPYTQLSENEFNKLIGDNRHFEDIP